MNYPRQLATYGHDTVTDLLLHLRNFDPMSEKSYMANGRNGSVVIYGKSAPLFDTTNVTILDTHANIHDACMYLSTFQVTGGVTYIVVCSDGRKVQIRLRSAKEELVLEQFSSYTVA